MSLTASSRSIPGTLRQDVVIDGRHRLITDEPTIVGGDDSAPAPHELFPAAVASCVSTVLVMYARTKKWDVHQVTVDVAYDHRSTPRRLEIAIHVSGNLTGAQIERLEKVASSCPVRRSIETGIEFNETITHGPTTAEPDVATRLDAEQRQQRQQRQAVGNDAP